MPRFAITTIGEEGEQILDGIEPLPIDEWTHIAVTRSGNTGTLYIDGVPVATEPRDDAGACGSRRHRRQLDGPAPVPPAQRLLPERGAGRVPDLRPGP